MTGRGSAVDIRLPSITSSLSSCEARSPRAGPRQQEARVDTAAAAGNGDLLRPSSGLAVGSPEPDRLSESSADVLTLLCTMPILYYALCTVLCIREMYCNIAEYAEQSMQLRCTATRPCSGTFISEYLLSRHRPVTWANVR